MEECIFNVIISWCLLTAHMHHELKYYGQFKKLLPIWYRGTVIFLSYVFVLVKVDPGFYDLLFYSSSLVIWFQYDLCRDRSIPRWYPVSLPLSGLYLFFFMYPYPGVLFEQWCVMGFLLLWWIIDIDY